MKSTPLTIDGMSSESFSTNAGVHQGSVISPTLFLIYINDVIGQTSNPTHCYADDSTLHGKPSLPNNRNNVGSSITLEGRPRQTKGMELLKSS